MAKTMFTFVLGVFCLLAAGPVLADWGTADGHKMHFPQLPDEEGWDVNATFPLFLADDWTCSETGPVEDVHFWGSWRDVNADGIGEVGNIIHFIISIHSDIPDPDGPTGPLYSMPGPELALYEVDEWALVAIDPPTWEHWFDPSTGAVKYNDHDAYFQYNIDLTQFQNLVPGAPPLITQEEGVIYWLNISAVVEASADGREWGWKSSRDHWVDDCVWRYETEPDWVELYEPPRFNQYNATFNADGTWGGGSGTNYYGNGWYYYDPPVAGENPWYNIWFYDNPFTYDHIKQAQILGLISPVNPDIPSEVIIAVNWSTDLWSQEGTAGQPPLPGVNQAQFIGRQIIYTWQGTISPETPPVEYFWEYSYNPEWISIDVWGTNFTFQGTIQHECVRTSMDLAFVITGGGAQPTGACCHPDGSCTPSMTQADCESDGASVYLGDGTVCLGDNTTPPNGIDDACEGVVPSGACCRSDYTCIQTTAAYCAQIGGGYMGDGSSCAGDSDGNGRDDLCEPPGTCCLPDLTCQPTTIESYCVSIGGTYIGDGNLCQGDNNSNGIDDACEDQGELKWESAPDLLYGDDLNCTYYPGSSIPPYLAAADFRCQQTGQITDIYVYGSWWLDILPNDDPHNVNFILSIHEDIPANPPNIPYSRPGALVCRIENPPFVALPFATDLHEGWLEPVPGSPPYIDWCGFAAGTCGDVVCWEYRFDISDYDCFQTGTESEPKVYWLDVQAYPQDDNMDAWFGWKTSWPPWNDDACYAFDVDDGTGDISWFEFRYPPNHTTYGGESGDLAFAIYGIPTGAPTGACCFDDGSCQTLTAAACAQANGTYGGDGSACAFADTNNNGVDDFCDNIVTLGACCYGDPFNPSCVRTTATVCADASKYGGTWYAGEYCFGGSFQCPALGACCYGSAISPSCVNATQADCLQSYNGTWYGGEDCDDPGWQCPTAPTGACCFTDGSCQDLTASACNQLSGMYKGDGTACLGDNNGNTIDDACEETEMKWFQKPDLSSLGGDVNCTFNPDYPPYILASDFLCTSTGPITEIHVFGSWYRDDMPLGGNPRAVDFTLSIHEDIPADPPQVPYSRPGNLICLIENAPFDVRIVAHHLNEAWFEPPDLWEPEGDQICWEYIFHVEHYECFQTGTESEPKIYWLDVQAYPHDPQAWFGWKTAEPPHSFDDAVFGFGVDGHDEINWGELRYPANHPEYGGLSVDLAFQIWGPTTSQPLGACCFDDGRCFRMTQADCRARLGNYLGDGTSCAGDGDGNGIDDACETPPYGACCLPSGQCIVTDLSNCQARNGNYLGDGSQCAGDNDGNGIDDACEAPPYGACCLPDGTCFVMTQGNCLQRFGDYLGDGTNCQGDADNNGVDDACEDPPPVGACCLPNGQCFVMPERYCLARNGHYHGDGTVCEGDADFNGIDDACEPPKGACCWPDGSCSIVTQAECENPTTSAPGIYKGDLTICSGDADLNGIDDGCEGPETSTKWERPPDLTIYGMDVYATESADGPRLVLAEDFPCYETGDILEIWVWGSWFEDLYPPGGPGSVPFTLSLHADIPDPDGPAGPEYSMPGELLWRRTFGPDQYEVTPFMVASYVLEEGFFMPLNNWYGFPADHNCWLYKFKLDQGEFTQQGEPNFPVVYWLDVQARQVPVPYYFGWKTTQEPWNDDGVWALGTDEGHGPWNEMIYPPNHQMVGQSINLAFAIVGESSGSCCVGRVGDANGSGQDEPTISDISVIIDALFISGVWTSVACLPEADVNQSGGPNPGTADITISDVSTLIDYLFITGPENATLNDCF